MNLSIAISIVWRLLLAVSLVVAPLVPTAAADPGAPAPEISAAAMPCHGDAPPPLAGDAPCDDGCCPLPDCDPGACRVLGPLIGALAPPMAATPAGDSPAILESAAPTKAGSAPLLRPPIA